MMTLAMVGLISFQIYWINNAIKVHEQRFDQNAHAALNEVVEQLERREVYSAATNSLNFNNYWPFTTDMDSIFSSTGNITRWDPLSIPDIHFEDAGEWQSIVEFEDSFNIGNQHITISYKINDRFLTEPEFNSKNKVRISPDYNTQGRIDSFRILDNQVRRNLQKVAEKSHMVSTVLDELMNPNRSVTGRIDKNVLEKLLNEALTSRGINLKYDYIVYNNDNKNIYFTNNNKAQKNDLLQSEMKINLYPNDFFGPPTLLSIMFPDEFGFLLKQVWFTLSSSFFLVILIIFSFTYAVYTIIKQKKLSEMKNDFINNMTHELKTPISTVSLACEALQDTRISRNNTFLNKYIQVIRDENDRLSLQVEKVLQMARLEKKDFELNLEKLDLHEIIDRVLENIRMQVEKRGGTIKCDLHASRTRLMTDEVHMTNILTNLLDNANKYSPDKPVIVVRTENSGTGIKMIISDKGIGMSKEVQKKIFDKFYRVSTGNLHDVKGFGLGLAYVKTMVHALGGEIYVSSIPHNGSNFEIFFPQDNG